MLDCLYKTECMRVRVCMCILIIEGINLTLKSFFDDMLGNTNQIIEGMYNFITKSSPWRETGKGELFSSLSNGREGESFVSVFRSYCFNLCFRYCLVISRGTNVTMFSILSVDS